MTSCLTWNNLWKRAAARKASGLWCSTDITQCLFLENISLHTYCKLSMCESLPNRALVLLKVSKCILHHLGHKSLPPYFMNFVIENINCFISSSCVCYFPQLLSKQLRRDNRHESWSTAWRSSCELQVVINRMGPRNLHIPPVSAAKTTHSSTFLSLLSLSLFTNTFSWSLGTVPQPHPGRHIQTSKWKWVLVAPTLSTMHSRAWYRS